MEINVVLKNAGKAVIVTEFRQMANVKSMSTHADSLRVLSSLSSIHCQKKQIRWKTVTRPIYDKEHCLVEHQSKFSFL